MIVIYLVIIAVISFILAVRSMKDFEMPREIGHLLKNTGLRGTIIFFKGGAKHYQHTPQKTKHYTPLNHREHHSSDSSSS